MSRLTQNIAGHARRLSQWKVIPAAQSFLGHWWPIAAQITGTALLAIAGASPHAKFEIGSHTHPWRPWLIGGGLVLLALGALNTGRRQVRLDRLLSERAVLAGEARAGARAVLRMIFHELDALRDAAGHLSNERVSLFRCDGNHFILVGRRSASPTYDRSAGRPRYPEDEGCLGSAWRESKAKADGLPHPGAGHPRSQEWLEAQASLGVRAETAEGLTMPSRTYIAFRIDGRERALGVLVFESLNSSTQAAQLGSKAALSYEALEPTVRVATVHLSQLLRESEFISAATVAELLPLIRD